MPTRNYPRKNDPNGDPADPAKGDPSFLSGVLTSIPTRTWRSQAAGPDAILLIDGGSLTGQEDTDLTAAHTAWVTVAPVPLLINDEDLDATEVSTTASNYPGSPQISFTSPVLDSGGFHFKWQVQLKTDDAAFAAWVKIEVDGVQIDEDSTASTVYIGRSGFANLTFDDKVTHTVGIFIKSEAGSASAYIKDFRYSQWRTS